LHLIGHNFQQWPILYCLQVQLYLRLYLQPYQAILL